MTLRRCAALAAGLCLMGIAAAPERQFPFPDVKLGQPVSRLITAHGSPDVVTTDVGHVWTWDAPTGPKIRLTTDDNGIVQIIDVIPKTIVSFQIPADTPQQRLYLAMGQLTANAADASSLVKFADEKGRATFPDSGERADFRAYRMSPDTELVLLFDAKSTTLGEAFYGERAALARSGLLLENGGLPEHYSAPAIVHQGAVDYPATRKQGDTFVRISVRKDGTVSAASVYASSGDPQLDNVAVLAAKQDTFTPAKLGDTAVDAVVFHKEEFRTLPAIR